MLRLALALLIVAGAGASHALDTARRDGLIAVCVSCHGAAGITGSEEIPALAGQNEGYLYGSLKDFKEGNRPSAQMRGISRELDDEEMRELARHFSAQPYVRGIQPVDPERAARGKEVYTRLCQLCHLEEGRSTTYDEYPLLAGQSLPYLLKEIKLIKDKRRSVELIKSGMLELASRQQIEDAIHFFAGQRVAPDQVKNSVTTPAKRTKRSRFRTDAPAEEAE
jgi:cytochrome subunit of sulfide dehydrogenase